MPVPGRKTVFREVLLGIRFGIVGALATLTHFAVLTIMLSLAGAGPVLANTVAYVLALGVSFTGHHFWTFNTSGSLLPTFLRFFGASGGAFLFSTLLLVFLIRVMNVSDPVAAFMSAAAIPLITYSASRIWVFRRRRD